MPEIKRIPQDGKMNTDFNVRILPPGQYREALNVNVGRSETSEVGTVENLLGNEQITSLSDPMGANYVGDNLTCIGSYRDNSLERVYFFVTSNSSANEVNEGSHAVVMYDQTARKTTVLVNHSSLNFHTNYRITGINLLEDLLFWTDNRNEPRKINVDRAIGNPEYYNSDVLMSVAKTAPYLPPTITTTQTAADNSITSTFLQDKLPRFSYRWQFEDGEFSVLAPFTPIIFSGSSSLPAADVINAGEAYDFVNDINSITLSVPVELNAGVVNVELLYKDSSNNAVYIIDDKPVASEQAISFDYLSQDPFRAIPESQITRVADAVPRVAQSQEVAGGRIVYGNYLQNYNLPNLDFIAGFTGAGSNPRLTNHAVKSKRTYQLGIVLSDRFGRTTPVILSQTGGDTTFVDVVNQQLTLNFTAEAATALQSGDFYSYKVVVKQREQDYYNWYTTSNTETRTIGGTAGSPITESRTGLVRRGDSVNKVPVDVTEFVTNDADARPSSRSVFVGNDLRGVTIDNIFGLATIAGGETGQVFYEVEPFVSELDIFFETSTGGLVDSIVAGDPVVIDFYNCYNTTIAGVSVEASRIREGFNEPTFDIGVRAHAIDEDFAGEERRSNALIHSSGFFNSRTGLNQLNQFNEAEGGITLSLDPADGSIQKLYAEDTQLIIWQEDKVSRSPIDKDFIYSAEGGAVPVTSSTQYLGTVAPYSGEYGISLDPGSFAVYGTRKYFTDKNRGVVLQLSNDGLTEINRAGMNDFFRDALRTSSLIVGSYNEYHNQYNLTITGEGYSNNRDTNLATAQLGQDYFTIGYEPDVRGWVSFKSFQQESGTTLNNVYYTFNGGDLWEHNSNNVDRNTFYGEFAPSHIDFVFNDAPSLVKDFKTIGYEGMGEGETMWSCDYIETDLANVGTVPEINTDFVRVALRVNIASGAMNAPNTRFTGERSTIVRLINGAAQARWVVAVSPISTQYELEDGDVTLTGGGSDVTINSLFNDSNGIAYFEVLYDVSLDSEDIMLDLGGIGADLVFQTTLLVINVLNGVTNSDLIGTIARAFVNEGSVEEEIIDVTGINNHYIDAPGNIEVDTTGIPDGILVKDMDNNNLGYEIFNNPDDPYGIRIELDVDIPTTPFGVLNLPINGTAVLAPELTWVLQDNPDFTTTFTNNEDRRVAPRDVDNKDANVSIVLADLTTDVIDDTTLLDFANANIANEVVYNEIAGTWSFDAVSTIDTDDTESTVDLSNIVVEDALITPAETELIFPFPPEDSNNMTITYESNLTGVNAWETSGDANGITSAIANGNITITVTPVAAGGGDNEATIAISPAYTRLTGIDDVEITVTQMGRVRSSEPTGTEVTFFYPVGSPAPSTATAAGGTVVVTGAINTPAIGDAPYNQYIVSYTGDSGTITIDGVDDGTAYSFEIEIPTP